MGVCFEKSSLLDLVCKANKRESRKLGGGSPNSNCRIHMQHTCMQRPAQATTRRLQKCAMNQQTKTASLVDFALLSHLRAGHRLCQHVGMLASFTWTRQRFVPPPPHHDTLPGFVTPTSRISFTTHTPLHPSAEPKACASFSQRLSSVVKGWHASETKRPFRQLGILAFSMRK